jgi:hypothetical protein
VLSARLRSDARVLKDRTVSPEGLATNCRLYHGTGSVACQYRSELALSARLCSDARVLNDRTVSLEDLAINCRLCHGTGSVACQHHSQLALSPRVGVLNPSRNARSGTS